MQHEALEAYVKLLEAAVRQRKPQSYADDLLKLDKLWVEKWCQSGEPLKFVWILRDCGTHIYFPVEEDVRALRATLRRMEQFPQDYADFIFFIYRQDKVYGPQLGITTPQGAMDFLLVTYPHSPARLSSTSQLPTPSPDL